MIRRLPRSTQGRSSAASDVYKRQGDLLAALGPCIGRCCYEVDGEAARAFQCFAHAGDFLSAGTCPGKWMLDLVEANRQQLTESGIPAGNIEASGLCTACRTDAFFSYRRSGGITGRQINFMMIKSGCLLYTFDAADDLLCVEIGGGRIIKKKKHIHLHNLSLTP